jgi:hypothetical protein
MDPDFDFLSYLDASLVDSVGDANVSPHLASSISSGGSSSSSHSFSAANTQYAATSPSATSSGSGYPRSPLFGVANGPEIMMSQQQQFQQQSPPFGVFDFAGMSASTYANSPPFDTSIFANFQQAPPQAMQSGAQNGMKLQESLNSYGLNQQVSSPKKISTDHQANIRLTPGHGSRRLLDAGLPTTSYAESNPTATASAIVQLVLEPQDSTGSAS